MIRRTFATAILVLTLAGCGMFRDPPKQGQVYDTEYTAAYSWLNITCVMYDNKGFCRIYGGHWVNEPAHWRLCLMDKQNDLKGCREVDARTFHEYKIGDYYPKPM